MFDLGIIPVQKVTKEVRTRLWSDRVRVRWWHYPVAVVLPVLAALPMVALLLLVIAPGHPSIHFPPIGAK